MAIHEQTQKKKSRKKKESRIIKVLKWIGSRIFLVAEEPYRSEEFLISKRLNTRIWILTAGLGLVMVILLLRLGELSLKRGAEYERNVLARMVGTESSIQPLRGNITDRNDKTLATSMLAYDICLSPSAILSHEVYDHQREKLYTTLAEYSGQSPEEVEAFVHEYPDSKYRVFMKKISAEDKQMLQSEGLIGTWYEETFVRDYPKNELAAQVLGFYNGQIGQYGIEQTYNDWMVGEEGRIYPTLQQGNIVTQTLKYSVDGSKVVLTIDEVIQQYVEQTMNKYIEKVNPLNAAALVMNPKTGEIYSMFSYPYYNPNTYSTMREQVGDEVWDSMEQEERSALMMRAWSNYNIQNPYELGSTLKPIMVGAALEEGYIDASYQFNCTGSINVHGQRIACWNHSGHGLQNVEQILANSCNPGVISIAEQVPTEVFHDYLYKFGFGQLTEIDMVGESAGSVHSLSAFGPVEKATAAMGQGFTATTLQLTTAFSALINGGYLVQPYIVSEIVDDSGNVIYDQSSQVKRQVISTQTSKQVTQMLESVITEGTGGAARIPGYSVAGKTGTAQKGYPREDGKTILSFIGYAPIDDPEVIAIVVFDELEDPADGSGLVGTVFSEMMSNILPYLKIGATNTDDTLSIQTATVPDVVNQSIQQGVQMLEYEGLVYEVIGVGNTIVGQYPLPGTSMPKESVVKIYLQSDDTSEIQTVPNLVGYTINEANQILGESFVLEGPENGKITSQIPKSGTRIEKNSTIIVQTLQ